jgi:MFS family permease
VIRRSVGEPELFVRKKATGFPVRLLVRDAATRKISLGMFILCSVQNFGYYGLMIWMPNYLARQFGFSLTQSALWTAVTILGMGLGIWLFGELADRIGRRPIFIAYQIGAFVMVLVYSQLTSPTALLIGGAIMGLFVNGMLGGYGALMSELYPTPVRATAQNVLFNLGRGVGGFGPVVIASLAGAYSFPAAIALLALIYLVDIAATYFLIPERRGMALE